MKQNLFNNQGLIVKYSDDTQSAIYNDSLQIRRAVFINEQKISEGIEISEENEAVYFVVYNDSHPIATCRTKKITDHTIKIQRFAVLKNKRKQEVGRTLLSGVEDYAKKQGSNLLVLGAQDTALTFYLKNDFYLSGDPFYEAGILHHPLEKKLV